MKAEFGIDQCDRRILELQLRSGKLSKKEYQKYLSSLPDSESEAEYIEISEENQERTSRPSGLTFTA